MRQVIGDWLILVAAVVLILFALLGVNAVARAGPGQVPIPPQRPPLGAVTVAPRDCGCGGLGNCVCGPSCPCAAHASTPTSPRPDGDDWTWNATEQHWSRVVEAPVAATLPTFQPVYNPPPLFHPTVFVPAPVRSTRPAFLPAFRAADNCVGGR
jgi:hypothetical protein